MKDLFIRRAYTYNKITVVVDIDLMEKKISLMEQWNGEFRPKNWLFAGRELEYMGGWLLILEAMKYAITQASNELKKLKKNDDDELLEMFLTFADPKTSAKKSKKTKH